MQRCVLFSALLLVIIAAASVLADYDVANGPSLPNVEYHGNQRISTLKSVASIRLVRNTAAGHICSAAILNTRYVLTVAHCTAYRTVQSLRIRVGAQPNGRSDGVNHEVSFVQQHPKYDSFRRLNDIALIRSRTAFVFGANVSPVAIGAVSSAYASSFGQLTGWIQQKNNNNGAAGVSTLRQLSTQIITNAECKKNYALQPNRANNVLPANICGRGTCIAGTLADGSELIENGLLVGLLSWRTAVDCSVNQPDVYVRVSSYRSWIQQNTRN